MHHLRSLEENVRDVVHNQYKRANALVRLPETVSDVGKQSHTPTTAPSAQASQSDAPQPVITTANHNTCLSVVLALRVVAQHDQQRNVVGRLQQVKQLHIKRKVLERPVHLLREFVTHKDKLPSSSASLQTTACPTAQQTQTP